MKSWTRTLASTLKEQWKRYRKALTRCQMDFAEPSIHASRIEARRLAAQLDLLRPFAPRGTIREAHRSIKRHLDTFDPLRDAQVQLGIIKKMCGGTKAARSLGEIIAKRERKCRHNAERRIRKINTGPTRRAVKALVERLRERDEGVLKNRRDRAVILHCVESAFAHAVDCRHRMSASDPATIHGTRVAFKKFRYMVEAMRPLLPEITERQLDAMKAFQDMLGDLQDTEVFLARVDKLTLKQRVNMADVAMLRKSLVRRHGQQVARCLRHADVVFKFWPLNWVSVDV